MKITEVLKIIDENKKSKGFRVSFEKHEGGILHSDSFPENDEILFDTEEYAWKLAMEFANATDPNIYVNIYVTTHDHRPVAGYEHKIIRKHKPEIL